MAQTHDDVGEHQPRADGTLHTERETHPWEINIPDHPKRTEIMTDAMQEVAQHGRHRTLRAPI